MMAIGIDSKFGLGSYFIASFEKLACVSTRYSLQG
jgi:hypothetical protein